MGALSACKPRDEVLKGELDDAIFAAEFGDLIMGKAPNVYGDAETFFQNTHPAKHLRKIVEVLFSRLANKKEGGATIRLSTGFGGGKTHTLMALWHLAHNIANPGMGTDLLPAAGRPEKITVAAVDARGPGTDVFVRHGKVVTRSLWGELAYWLGGEKAVMLLGETDNPERQPDIALVEQLIPSGPVLFLIDELVTYMALLSERGQGNLLAFMGKLMSLVGKRPQTVLVVTDPAAQRVYARQSAKLAEELAAAEKLDDIFGRKMTEFDPIGDEAAQVIVRRLFERVNPTAAQAASATYHSLYERVARESPGLIPPAATTPGYAKRIVECYPFHPRLLETVQERLGALGDFQKSRGTLRLFARIIRTTWESGDDLELIPAGDVDWSSDAIQSDLLNRLHKDNFKAAVTADIERHATELDGEKRRGIHVRVASALLLESIPMQSNSGFEPADLTLAVLRPEEAGPEPSEALDRLVGICWHTYLLPSARGWQFRYEPNIIKQIEERMSDIPLETAKDRVYSEAQGYFSGLTFRVTPWPMNARQVPESARLQLALCETEKIARLVCSYSDDSDPASLIPRRFQNAIVAVAPITSAFNAAVESAQRLLACEAIEREHRTGEAGRLVREQLQKVKPGYERTFRIQTRRAFDRVVLAGGHTAGMMEEKFQVSDDQILERAHGQSNLLRYLQAKGLIYELGDALDLDRFLKDILPGATPLVDNPEVRTARPIHERFLSAPGLRLLPDESIVRATILRAVAEGRLVVFLKNENRAYDSHGCVEGPQGMRRRIPEEKPSTLPLDESVLVALQATAPAQEWTREDKEGQPPPLPPPPPPPERMVVRTWEELLEGASRRPVTRLTLTARTPAAAHAIIPLLPPLNPENVILTVNVDGRAKDGGMLRFNASNVKPTHPTRPLAIAQTLFNAIDEGGEYEASFELTFGQAGRIGMEAALQDLKERAPQGIEFEAQFRRPTE